MPSKGAARPDVLAQAVARQVRTELTARDLDLSALFGVIGARSYVYSRLSVDKASHALTLTEVAVGIGGVVQMRSVLRVKWESRAHGCC